MEHIQNKPPQKWGTTKDRILYEQENSFGLRAGVRDHHRRTSDSSWSQQCDEAESGRGWFR